MKKSLFINGQWFEGTGNLFKSINPSDGTELWEGNSASSTDINAAFDAAKSAHKVWSNMSFVSRKEIILKFKNLALEANHEISELISKETGKQLWDSKGEASALPNKVDVSLTSYLDRTGKVNRNTPFGSAALRHKSHGVFAVLGPYNFPAHLPNGQILPALIAGNTIVFKPSDQTPAVGEALIKLYEKAGFPKGVINMVQGSGAVGKLMLDQPDLSGVLFTGSAESGRMIHKKFGGKPEVILALEMGGNNPIIAWDVDNAKEAASIIIQSAFITSGQRCTCARRLIVPDNDKGQLIVESTMDAMDRITINKWNIEASMGPVINQDAASKIVEDANSLNGKVIRASSISELGSAFVTPAFIDVTDTKKIDKEIFGPVLQVVRVPDWGRAIYEANNTNFGLAAGLISNNKDLWETFRNNVRAGIVNFNRPTTGAASFLPFGGPGFSGNHNPGAYYSADFCAWPMASQISNKPSILEFKGLK